MAFRRISQRRPTPPKKSDMTTRAKFAFVANLPVDQALRLRRFKDNHRLTSAEVIVYLMNRADLDPEGEEITVIDYGTLTPRR